MTSAQIRQQFIDFFVKKHGHTFVPSSPVVPHDDPTLLFTNAGMNQFKPIFLGQEKRPYTRAANTQKCIRAGGKHNDLDDVGRSRRHETFFEMLGNWSFGDYFKRGAIEMAWELLTKVWKLEPDLLHVTCFQGDERAGVPRDTEAAEIWKEVAGLPDDHIHYLGKENFWEMGDTGPCGPCTEIFIDRTPKKTGGPSVVRDDDPRVMEFWNLVFIQYNRNADRSLTVLPSQHVDTGMGLERICQVLQDKSDVYAIDLWHPYWAKLTELSGHTYSGKFPPRNTVDAAAEAADQGLRKDIAFRVIADHARCLTFALTDGAVPSNEGRGYVLRRILRRAVFWGWQHLGLKEPFLFYLVDVVVGSMVEAFPELRRDPGRVKDLIKDEELSFGRTLARGVQLFEETVQTAARQFETAKLVPYGSPPVRVEPWTDEERKYADKYPREKWPHPVISDETAFKLHDTYGFPIDLTQIMAEERGFSVDIAGYERLMQEAKERSRPRETGQEFPASYLPPSALSELERDGIPTTDDSAKYERERVDARVVALWTGINFTHKADHGEYGELAIILDRTCFYAEMGGQAGDMGELGAPGTRFLVKRTKSIGGYVLHVGELTAGTIKTGTHLTAVVDNLARPRIESNHTATHVANWALREVLGEGVQQKGSLVDPEKLRFDFSHGKSMSEDEIRRVEDLVNQCIRKSMPVYAEVVPQEKALKIHGLRAVFGEKYPPMVRVVSIGKPVADLLADPENSRWRQFSVEFCGGTHLKNTAEAVTFVITAEESISKGIRRIVALTGDAAEAVIAQGKSVDSLIDEAKKKPEPELPGIIAALQKSIASGDLSLRAKRRAQAAVAELQEKLRKWEKANKAQSAGARLDIAEVSANLLSAAPAIGAGRLVVAEVPGATPEQLLSVTDSLKKKVGSYAVLLSSTAVSKVNFVAAVSDDLVAQGLKAGDWIREAAKATGGGGGGRPNLAQAGGKDPAKLADALKVATEFATRTITLRISRASGEGH